MIGKEYYYNCIYSVFVVVSTIIYLLTQLYDYRIVQSLVNRTQRNLPYLLLNITNELPRVFIQTNLPVLVASRQITQPLCGWRQSGQWVNICDP